MGRKNKGGKELAQTKDQTPLLPLSGSRKVVRTPTNPFEAAGTIEVFVPKEIIARRIQERRKLQPTETSTMIVMTR